MHLLLTSILNIKENMYHIVKGCCSSNDRSVQGIQQENKQISYIIVTNQSESSAVGCKLGKLNQRVILIKH